jgi:hypothetical protein
MSAENPTQTEDTPETPAACCAPSEAASCCAPTEKAGCCGSKAAAPTDAPPARCGCR